MAFKISREKRQFASGSGPPLLLSPDFYFRANIHWVCMCVCVWEGVSVFMSRCVWVGLQSDVLKSIWPCLKMSCLCNLSCAITWMSHICHFLIPLKREGPLRTYFSRYSTFGTYIKNHDGGCWSLGTPYVNFDEILTVTFENLIWLIILIDCLRNIFPGNTDRGYGKRDHNVQRLTPHPHNVHWTP